MATRRRAVLLAALGLMLGCSLWRRAPEPSSLERLDLNRAPLRQVETLPGITPSLARRIVEGRPYGELDELVARGILTRRELDRIADRVTVERAQR